MRNIRVALLILCLPFLVLPLAAQMSYLATYDMTGGNPGGVNTDLDNDLTGWTSILGNSLSSNAWSAAQTIPFSFSLFGSPVTQFKVSANGLVTFDVGATALPSVNGDLIDPALPDNTIACFWDEFTDTPPTGSNDEVYIRVYGTAGSQQLWIKWFSFEYGNPSDDSFNYFACVLEEGTGNVYMVDMGNSGNATNMSTTVGIQKDATLAAQFGTSTISFGTGSSSNTNNNTFYQFEPFMLNPFDLKADMLITPSGAGCYSAASDVRIRIVNQGTSDATGMTATYSINGQAFITPETIPGTIVSGDTIVYTFTTQADLSAITTYDVVAAVTLTGDALVLNDTASAMATSLAPISAPFVENFDAGIPTDWTNEPSDEGEVWKNSIAGDANNGPGPIDHTTGSGEYMWVDDSGPHSAETNFITPCIDLSGMTAPVFDFWLWSFNNNTAGIDMILHIDLQVGGVWNNDVLNPFTSQSAAWIPIQFSLTPYVGEMVRVRFRMEENGGGFEHDIAIDDVSVMEGIANDIALLSIVSPSEADCGLTTTEPISIQIANQGVSAATGITASFSVGGNPAIPAETIPGTLQLGDTLTYTFTATADLATLGTQSLDVSISFPGDLNSSNDSLTTLITTLGIVSAPYAENFDAGFPSDWLNDPIDDGEEWLSSTSGIAGFGPDGVDHTSGTGEYLWVDDSGPHSANTNLITPCIDLSTMVLPELEFWVWSNNEQPVDDDTKLHVDIHSNGVWTQDIIAPIVDMDSMWEQVLIDISAFSGTVVKVRFRMEEFDTGFRHDIAIDDFRIFEELTDDVRVSAILSPSGVACGFTSTETVSIEIENLGSNPISGIMGSFQVNGGAVSPTENIPGTLAPGATMTYDFIATADLSATGLYTIRAVANAASDQNSLNDSLEVNVEHLTATFPPLISNLESYPIGTTQFSNLFNDSINAQIPWQINTGMTPTSNTGPADDVSMGGAYLFVESSGSDSGDLAIICFECVDLTGFSSPDLEFSYHLFGSSIGSLSVDINSGGTSTNELLLVGQQQDSSAAPWITQNIDLSAYAGSVIEVCFTGEITPDGNGDTFKGDMAIDGLQITQIFTTDVGATGLAISAEPCLFSDAEPITLQVANSSQSPVSNIILSYAINGGAFTAPEILAGPIAAGDTVPYTFTATADLSALGSYDIVAAAIINGDENATNDTTEFTIENTASTPVAGFTSSVNMNTATFTNASSGGGNVSYTWDFGDGSPLSNDENPVYTYPNPGGYSVLLIVSNECGSTSIRDSVIIVDPTMGLDEAFAAQIQVFPNPNTGRFEIKFGQSQLRNVEISVFSIQGQQVYRRDHSVVAGPGLIPVQLPAELTEGMYLMELKSTEGTAHQRLMLRK